MKLQLPNVTLIIADCVDYNRARLSFDHNLACANFHSAKLLSHNAPKLPSEIINKIKSFSHQEFNNPKYTDLQTVINHIKSGKDYLGRESNRFIPFDVNSLPPDFISIFSKVTRSRDNLTEVVSN